MKRFSALLMLTFAASFALLGGRALIAGDTSPEKYALQITNGLSFNEFRGYEGWEVITVSQSDDLLKVILGNPAMMQGYRAGAPADGKVFPDGSKMAKIMWKPV